MVTGTCELCARPNVELSCASIAGLEAWSCSGGCLELGRMLTDGVRAQVQVRELIAAAQEAYGLLWHHKSDGSPNAKLVTKARGKLLDQLTRAELAAGITAARPICAKLGVRFDPISGGAW